MARHKARGSKDQIFERSNFGKCSCGKMRFGSRKAAKAVIAKMRHREGTTRLKPYRCLVETEWFHLGHQPTTLARGYVDRGKLRY